MTSPLQGVVTPQELNSLQADVGTQLTELKLNSGTFYDNRFAISELNFNFIKQGIVVPNDSGKFDSAYATRPHIVKADSTLGKYHLYYLGNTSQNNTPGVGSIGLSVSDDGVNWEKYAGAPLASVNGGVDFFVMRDEKVDHKLVAYFSKNLTTISRREASNDDGTEFGAVTDVLSVGATGTWDDVRIQYPSVIKRGTQYLLYYMGLGTSDTSWRIGVAISEDGITFKKSPLNPVMEPRLTNPWESGHVFDPHAFAIGNVIYMGYTGGTVNPLAEQIGVASSVDGINFNRYSTMPIISLGGVGNFDETWTIDPEMILIGNKLHLYYTGHNANGDRQIGLAIAEQGV